MPADVEDAEGLDARLLELADRRMPQGELCPPDLLPVESCEAELREALTRTGLTGRRNVSIYGLTAA